MKSTIILPVAALTSAATALVIPEFNSEAFKNSVAAKQDAANKIAAQLVGTADKAASDIASAAGLAAERISDLAAEELDVIASQAEKVISAAAAALAQKPELAAQDQQQEAPLVATASAREYGFVPYKYIVVFKKNLLPEEISFHKEFITQSHLQSVAQLDPTHSFFVANADAEFGAQSLLGGIEESFKIGDLLSGYVGYFTDDIVELIRKNPLVEFVEKDSIVEASTVDVQNGAPWGLARISHREALSLGTFNKYLFDEQAGEGVTSYVIDTGINVEHEEFEGRAIWGKTVPQNDFDEDGNGHGTHCAGTIASKHYGVAKKAKVVAIKVLKSNGSGTMSDVVKGVEYAAKAHLEAVKSNKKGFKGSTANMSLGGGKSPALDLAVNAAVKAGIHFAVAAGNDNADACNYSPAAAELAITVGASTISDDRAYFSNYGSCVDIFGPGLNILSTYIGSKQSTAVLSGTSMASPHVAGLLTYYLSLQPDSDSAYFTASKGITTEQLKKKILAYGTKGVLSDLPEGTPNNLIYNGAGGDLDDFWGTEVQAAEHKVSKLEELEMMVEAAIERLEDVMENINIL